METFAFATLRGVFPPEILDSNKRPYIPRGSRTHISMTADINELSLEEQKQQIGIPRRVKGSGGNNNNNDNEDKENNKDKENNNKGISTALMGLIATDPYKGNCITRTTANIKNDGETIYWESLVLPSQRRIASIQLSNESYNVMQQEKHRAAWVATPTLYVADVVGNIYSTTLPETSIVGEINGEEAPMKRLRRENNNNNNNNNNNVWHLIAPSTMGENINHNNGISNHNSNISNAYGAPGWCGVIPLLSDNNSQQLLLNCREFFMDLRLIDVVTGSLLRVHNTTHTPTGISKCLGIPNTVVVAEGPLATIYDIRSPTVALTLNKDIIASTKTSGEGNTSSLGEIPRITSRLTSPMGFVTDVCSTCNEYEVALAIGRSVCVHDIRKWSRVGVTTNVLKYEIASIAPFAKGKAVVAAGIDAEVRIVGLHKNNSSGSNNNGNEQAEEPGSRSFRNRLDSVVSCQSTWLGGWVESINGVCASGISVDNEVFLSF